MENRGLSAVQCQQTQIENIIRSLMQDVSKLAPHPSKPDHTGPLFISSTSEFKPPAEYDGMLGTIMMESLLQSSFFSAAMDVADTVTTYMQDRQTKPAPKLGKTNVIRRFFNATAQRESMMKAYLADLPKRLGIEAGIAYQMRKLYALRKNALRLGYGTPLPA